MLGQSVRQQERFTRRLQWRDRVDALDDPDVFDASGLAR